MSLIDPEKIVWKPNPGGQVRALTCPADECLFHGSRGSGKSDVLLMDFAQNIGRGFGMDYRGLILREATTELKDIISKSLKYFPRLFPGAKFNSNQKVWTFPDGEYLWFNYARVPKDYGQYHGSEWCVHEETKILLADGAAVPAKHVSVGQYVSTLDGAKRVNKVFRSVRPAFVFSAYNTEMCAEILQIQGVVHPLLSASGWHRAGFSALFSSSAPNVLNIPYLLDIYLFLHNMYEDTLRSFVLIETRSACTYARKRMRVLRLWAEQLVSLFSPDYTRVFASTQEDSPDSDIYTRALHTRDKYVCNVILQNIYQCLSAIAEYCYRSYYICDDRTEPTLPDLASVVLLRDILFSEVAYSRYLFRTLHPFVTSAGFPCLYPHKIGKNHSALPTYRHVRRRPDSTYDCYTGHDRGGIQSHAVRGIALLPVQSGSNIPEHFRLGLHKDAQDSKQLSLLCPPEQFFYRHPYTSELHASEVLNLPFREIRLALSIPEESVPSFVPCSYRVLYQNMIDFEIEEANHYITIPDILYRDKHCTHENQGFRIGLVNHNSYIGWEELTNHPTDEVYQMLMSCLRSPNKQIPLKYRANCNPGGVGAPWVKARFIDTVPEGRIYIDEFGKSRTHIFIPTAENKVLMEATPEYQNTLMTMTAGNENLRKAWVYGSWDIIMGGFFTDVWDPQVHVLKSKVFGDPFAPAFKIPHTWKVKRSFDWGSAKPWSVTYGAICNGDQPDGLDFELPVGSVIVIDEIYGWTGKPNEGDGATSAIIADRVLKKDKELQNAHSALDRNTNTVYTIRVSPGPADNSIWTVIDGTSIGLSMQRLGLHWQHSYKGPGSRRAGVAIIRDMLYAAKQKDPEKPHLYFFQSATNHIRTIPMQQRSTKDPEDIDSDLEDHCIAKGELVFTVQGQKPIEDIVPGDRVYTRTGFKEVLKAWKARTNAEILEIHAANNASFRCTPDHDIYTCNRGFVQAQNLRRGDIFLWFDQNSLVYMQELGITKPVPFLFAVKLSERADVYDLTVDEQPEFFCNNILVSNCIDSLKYLLSRKNMKMMRGGVRM